MLTEFGGISFDIELTEGRLGLHGRDDGRRVPGAPGIRDGRRARQQGAGRVLLHPARPTPCRRRTGWCAPTARPSCRWRSSARRWSDPSNAGHGSPGSPGSRGSDDGRRHPDDALRPPARPGYFADPFVLRLGDEGYAAYGTHPAPPDGDRIFDVLLSPDLVSWSRRRHRAPAPRSRARRPVLGPRGLPARRRVVDVLLRRPRHLRPSHQGRARRRADRPVHRPRRQPDPGRVVRDRPASLPGRRRPVVPLLRAGRARGRPPGHPPRGRASGLAHASSPRCGRRWCPSPTGSCTSGPDRCTAPCTTGTRSRVRPS